MLKKLSQKTCEYCEWWVRYRKDNPTGYCNRYPPKLLVLGGEISSRKPETAETNYCKEFELEKI